MSVARWLRPDTPPTMFVPDSRYRSLDAWRGLACLMVVVYHATLIHMMGPVGTEPSGAFGTLAKGLLWLTSYGNRGVTLFFVISGYCIAAAADSARRRPNCVASYFWRRFRRIYPPLWIVIAFGVGLFLVVDDVLVPGLLSAEPWQQPRPWWFDTSQWFGNLTLTETWRHYVFGSQRAHFPGQAWTLCFEEQFYAVTGLLLWVAPRRFFEGAAAFTALTGVCLLFATAYGVPVAGFFFDGSWFLFAAGMLVYWATNCELARYRSAAAFGLAVGAVACAAASTTASNYVWGFAFAGVLILTRPYDRRLIESSIGRVLGWCGTMCYSLYLVHQWPVKAITAAALRLGITSDWAALLLVVPVCVACALVLGRGFYLTVERRFLNSPAATSSTSLERSRPSPALA